MPQVMTLNDLLDQLDSRLGKLEAETGQQTQDILQNFDEIKDRFVSLQDQEQLLRVEHDQFEYLQSRLRKNAGLALHDLGGIGALHTLRDKAQPDRERWWWFLDEEIALRRRQSLKGNALILTIVIAVVAVLVLVYQFFLAPDPSLVAAVRYRDTAVLALSDGNIGKALDSMDQALENQPNDPELMIFKGILLHQLGEDPQQVSDLYAQAEHILGGREKFLVTRSMLYLQSSNYNLALEDAQAVIQMNPTSPLGHYYAGTAYESLGDGEAAIKEYNIGYQLAEQQGQTELAATIRISYAMLSQAGPDLYGTSTP